MKATKKNTVEQALTKALLERVRNSEEIRQMVNDLTGHILGEAEILRGDDVFFNDALHPDVHNTIQESIEAAVTLIVENWDLSDEDEEFACPGCKCKPGDGRTPNCTHPQGCGYFAAQQH